MKIAVIRSCNFVKQMQEVSDYLSKKEHKVFLPEPLVTEEQYAEEHGRDKLLQDKAMFTKKHCKRIENSDALLIINPKKKDINGYIGTNTLMELSIAFHFDKLIFLLYDFDKSHPHYEGLVGLNATILNGDLDLIK